MTQEKKQSLQTLLMGTSAMAGGWIMWLLMVLFWVGPKELGLMVLMALPLSAMTLVWASAAIEDVKHLMGKNKDRGD